MVLLSARGAVDFGRRGCGCRASDRRRDGPGLGLPGGLCLWLMLARSYHASPQDELPESETLALVFRELQWASLLTAVALLASFLWPAATTWAGRMLLGWVIVVGRRAIRPTADRLVPPTRRRRQRRPAPASGGARGRFRPRQSAAQFVRHDRGGVGASVSVLRGRCDSYAGRSCRRIAAVGLLLWGLSSLAVVQIDELGVRESFGRHRRRPRCRPGLHVEAAVAVWPRAAVSGQARRGQADRFREQPRTAVELPVEQEACRRGVRSGAGQRVRVGRARLRGVLQDPRGSASGSSTTCIVSEPGRRLGGVRLPDLDGAHSRHHAARRADGQPRAIRGSTGADAARLCPVQATWESKWWMWR